MSEPSQRRFFRKFTNHLRIKRKRLFLPRSVGIENRTGYITNDFNNGHHRFRTKIPIRALVSPKPPVSIRDAIMLKKLIVRQ